MSPKLDTHLVHKVELVCQFSLYKLHHSYLKTFSLKVSKNSFYYTYSNLTYTQKSQIVAHFALAWIPRTNPKVVAKVL